MYKRNKKREGEFESALEKNAGKTIIFEYINKTGKEFNKKIVAGKIGKLEIDHTNSKFGNRITIEKLTEEEKIEVLSQEFEQMPYIIGSEKPENYKEFYHTRRINNIIAII